MALDGPIVALAGGVGGAKLSSGLYHEVPPGSLTLVINTADDVEILGLHVSPDLDTALYTLAGMVNQRFGWGIDGDTFGALDLLGRYGHPRWFNLGDRDLATHLMRTDLLRQGQTLTQVMAHLASALEVHARLLPMCDERVETYVQTATEILPFQEYFVHRRAADPVRAVELRGIAEARVTPEARAALDAAGAVVFCPSNPIVSIGPILRVPEMRDLLRHLAVPRIAVSPIVGGDAVSGPAGRMLSGLGHECSARGVARLYAGLLTHFVVDEVDAALAPAIQEELDMKVIVAPTLMSSLDDKRALARRLLSLGDVES
ncbi:MAG: 2-phospho-L-lactate transferase [Chloroflexota bacterium]